MSANIVYLIMVLNLITAILLFTYDERIRIPIKIFSFGFFIQFATYFILEVVQFPPEQRLFIGRSTTVTVSAMYIIFMTILRLRRD